MATCLSIPAARFALCFIRFYFVVCSFCLVNQSRIKGEVWSTANWFKLPSNFIAGHSKVALLLWFFGGLRCCVWLRFVRYKNRKYVENTCLMLGSRCRPVWEMAVHLAVAGDVFDGVLFCAVLFSTRWIG